MRNWPYIIIYVIRTNKRKQRLFLTKRVRQASAYWHWLHVLATRNSNSIYIPLFYVVQWLRKNKKAEINSGTWNGPFCHAQSHIGIQSRLYTPCSPDQSGGPGWRPGCHCGGSSQSHIWWQCLQWLGWYPDHQHEWTGGTQTEERQELW